MRSPTKSALIFAAMAGIAAMDGLPRRELSTDKTRVKSDWLQLHKLAAAEAKRARKAAKRAAQARGGAE